ncbi:MFS multidrug transporter [Purpureocillium lavendulum]|uniref:MFS multidrug transporter n=1 Tax=Purpureocillium lavendulum TaxID=1247861 RepID=A0AB34G6R2_9HYPO|nr:MFS multidrug transporter [Purpureocillium lavendulum]
MPPQLGEESVHTEMPSNESTTTLRPGSDELEQHRIDVEKLGRERPAAFSSTCLEIAFVVSMLVSLSMAEFVIGGFQVVLPALVKPFDIPAASQTWPSSVLTLVAGSFLFPLGRITDMYGGYVVFNIGLIWFSIWVVAAGFAQNFTTLVLCRAMEGLGAAAFLPAGISLLGTIYRPGPRKNLVFALYGATAPLGFFSGIIIGGLAQDLLKWRWYFWIGGIVTALCCVGALLTSPRDYAEARKMNVKMDWWGTCTMIPGLMLTIYSITESSHAQHGWASPEIVSTLVLGLLFLAATVYVEGWVATAPLIPADIFRVKYIKRMLFCLLLSWGVFSVYLFYTNFYIETILGKSALLTAVWFAPWAASGVILSIFAGLILHVFPGRVLLIFSGICKVVAVLLFAFIPENPNYWAWVFPAMVCEAACVDVLWTVSNVFLTTSLPRHRQGMAGAVITITVFVGGALVLAIADVAKGQFEAAGLEVKLQYKGVFLIAAGLALLALISCSFIKLGKAGCALTVDEKEREKDNGRKAGDRPALSRRNTQSSDATAVDSDAEVMATLEGDGEKTAVVAVSPLDAARK